MKRTIITFMLIACVTRSATAQELTLTQAIERALQTHPTLALAEANVERAQSGVREASAARKPYLTLDATVTEYEKPWLVAPLHSLNPRNLPVFDHTLGQGNAALSYTLFDAARSSRIDRARQAQYAAMSSADAARMQVLSDVVRAYIRVQTTREVAQAQTKRIEALTSEENRSRQLVEQGKAARVALLRTQAALSSARADAVLAATDAETAENELARLLEMSVDSLRRMRMAEPHAQTRAAIPNVQALHDTARVSNPDLERARRQIAVAQATRGEARGLYLPRVQLGGRFTEYTSPATRPQGEFQGGAQLSYAVFTGGTRGAANDRANAEVRAAEAEFQLVARRVDDAIDRAVSALRTANARVQALETAVAQSEEVTRIDRLALEAGAGVQSDYLTAEADLFRARAALSDARAVDLLARVELARVTGLLTVDWIRQNVESSR